VLSENIEQTYILRPSIIGGNRTESRMLEKLGIAIFKSIAILLVGTLRKYRLIEAAVISRAMHNLANNKIRVGHRIESNEIERIGCN